MFGLRNKCSGTEELVGSSQYTNLPVIIFYLKTRKPREQRAVVVRAVRMTG